MANIILNQQAEAELKKLGFHNKRMPNSTMTELDRIKADEELVAQINEFIGKGKSFLEIPNKGSGAYYSPKKGNIYFEPNSQYITARILAHEVGHALGKNQAKSVRLLPYCQILRPSPRLRRSRSDLQRGAYGRLRRAAQRQSVQHPYQRRSLSPSQR